MRRSLLGLVALLGACGGAPAVAPAAAVSSSDGAGAEDCAGVEPLAVRVDAPANVSMLFALGDCASDLPLVELERLSIVQGGARIPDEAHRDLITDGGVTHVVVVLVDVTDGARPTRGDDLEGVRRLAGDLLAMPGTDVLVGLRLFDGSEGVHEWQAPTDDVALLEERIDQLSLHPIPDPGARNLFGALEQGVLDLQVHLSALAADSGGGVVAVGHLVALARGGDTAGRVGGSAAQAAIRQARSADGSTSSTPTVRVVGLGADLEALLVGGAVGGAADLAEDWSGVWARVSGRIEATHLLSFCSSQRAGSHWTTVGLTDGAGAVVASTRFVYSAEGFTGGCHGTQFRTACDGQGCGGWLCGRCDARTETCVGDEVRSCRQRCSVWDACEDGPFVHPLGDDLSCAVEGDMRSCDGQCVDVSSDREHCGRCGVSCAGGGALCVSGQCQCPGVGDQRCDGQCVRVSADIRHCGACGVACVPGSQRCDEGVCVCIGPDTDGDGECDDRDPDNDGDGCADGEDATPNEASDDSDDDGRADDCDACEGDDAAGDVDEDGLCDDLDDDDDDDGCLDADDRAPGVASVDGDGDGVADDCDGCQGVPDDDAPDTDDDGTCDAEDLDDDGDGCLDADDPAPLLFSPDTDEDGVADDCDVCAAGPDDVDADADGSPDACDLCVGADASGDTDDDGRCDDVDPDDDGDGCPDAVDAAPQVVGGDADGDGVGDDCDACDGDDDPACRCEEDAHEPNQDWRDVILGDEGADHGHGVGALDDLVLMPGDEDWHSFAAAAVFRATVELTPSDHCQPPLQVRQQRICVQLQFFSWTDFDRLLGDGVPDDLGEPVCGSLAEGLEVGPHAGGPGMQDLWTALLVRVYRHPDDGAGVGPAPYALNVRR